MENIYWKKTVGTLIGAIWLYTLADIAASITGAVNEILNPSGALGMIKDLMEGGSGAPILSMGDIIESMFSILVLVGYYLFFSSLTRFSRLQSNKQDGEYVSTVRTAYILLVVALIVDFIPFIGWLASFVIMVIAYVKMLSGYSGLKKSVTFPPEAQQGASTLYSCTIWTLVGYVLGCIPFIGSVIEGIITLVVFFMILSAWGRIKNGAPELTPEEEEAFKRDEVPAYKQILGDWLIIFFFVILFFTVIDRIVPILPDFSTGIWVGYQVFCGLTFIGLYLWLLFSPQAQLNRKSKWGLGILLFHRILIFAAAFIGDGHSLGDVVNVNSSVFIIGMLLFIWCSVISRKLKIIVTLYVIIAQFLVGVLTQMSLQSIPKDYPAGGPEPPQSMSAIIMLSVIIGIVFFILIFRFVSQWRKQPTDINIVNK